MKTQTIKNNLIIILAVVLFTFNLTGCNTTAAAQAVNQSVKDSADSVKGAAEISAAEGTEAAEATDETGSREKVRIILDWTPNTNHTGIYVAQALGYYDEAGIDVEILPFSQSGVEPVLVAGEAEFGISGSSSLVPANAAGADLRAVEVVVAHPSIVIGFSAERDDIKRPKDLEGKVYAGFGLSWENAIVDTVIRTDGGTGDYESVSLSTSAYEAVYSGAADFALPLLTWEGIEAELNGTPLNYIYPSDYDVPADYPLLIAAPESYLKSNPETARAFVQATQKGYTYAADNPDEAARILIDSATEVLKNEELVLRSQELLSAEYYRADDGRIGFSDAEAWQAYSDWLFEAGVLTDAEGNPVAEAPKAEDLFTNEFLADD